MDQSANTTPQNIFLNQSVIESIPAESCSCLGKFHKLLGKIFYNLGYLVAKFPYRFIIIPFCISILFATGFLVIKYENDPEHLYSPSDARSWYERNVIETLFPNNYTHGFDPSRIVTLNPFARLIISAKDNKTMFRTRIWNDVTELDRTIRNLSITWEGSTYSFRDICARFDSECIENKVLNLNEIMSEIEEGITMVNYPIMLFPLVLPFAFGGVEVDENEGVIKSTKFISLDYWFKEGDAEDKKRSIMFEKKILQLLKGVQFEKISVAFFTSIALEEELNAISDSLLPYLGPTALIIFGVTTISMFEFDWVRSKLHVGLMGLVTSTLSVACSFGFLMYCQVSFSPLNWAAPFILLGIGLDDMFVLISAWKRTDIRSDVPERLANTYSEAAFSITITSLTNMTSFLLGTTSTFASVSTFCLYTGVSVLVAYLFFITFFGAFLALAGYQEQQQRHALTCRVLKAKSEAEGLGAFSSRWNTGGINKNDPFNPTDNQPHFIMTCFKKHVARILSKPIVQVLVICMYFIYMAGAIYGLFHMQEGLKYTNMVRYDSYLTDYFTAEEQFKKFPSRIQVIINENITYSDPETKIKILDLHQNFENLSCIAPRLYTDSWIRRFYKFLERKPEISSKIIDETSFIQVLKEHYLTPGVREILDVVLSDDETRILASRFIIQSFEVHDTTDEKEMMTAVRKVAQEAPFDMVVSHPYFLFYDQYLAVRRTVLQTVALVAVVMMVIAFIFIPKPLASFLVTLSIVSIIVGVTGYMSLWKVKLDGISMINLIMCVGFSVDYSAHISYAYLTAKSKSAQGKMEECLFSLGYPIVQSGVTTIAAMIMFLMIPAYVHQTFFKIIFMVIIFGTLHAIFILPVTLSLIDTDICRKQHSCKTSSCADSVENSTFRKIPSVRWNQTKVHPITNDSTDLTFKSGQEHEISSSTANICS